MLRGISATYQSVKRGVESMVHKKPVAPEPSVQQQPTAPADPAPSDPVLEALRIHLPVHGVATIVVDYSKFTPAQHAQARALGVLAAQRPVEGNYHDTPVKMHRGTRRLCELIIFLSQIEGMAPSDANALERFAESLEQPHTHDSLRELARSVLKQFPPKCNSPTFEGLQVWYMTYAFASTVVGRGDLTGLFSRLCGQLATECGGRMQHQVIYPPEPLKDVDQIHWARVQQAASIFQSLLSECSDDDIVCVKYGDGRRSWQPNEQLEPAFMLSQGVELQPVDARRLTPLEVARVRANMDRGDWNWLPGLKDAVQKAVAALDATGDHAG